MEQIRQLLSQLALHLELNIAMCDLLEEHTKRLDKLEPSHEALKTKLDALSTRVSELYYAMSSKALDERRKSRRDV